LNLSRRSLTCPNTSFLGCFEKELSDKSMSEVPYMPEVVARHFAQAVKASVAKVHRPRRHVIDHEDVESEAWVIALQRWQLWSDQVPLARKDLELKLRHWIESRHRGLGWTRPMVDGKRRWIPPTTSEVPWAPEWISERQTQDDDSGDSEEVRFGLDWQPMGRAKRRRFAQILMRDYPTLVAEFEAADSLSKPSNLSHAEYGRRKERTRARLRVKYAQELAEARYAVEGFGKSELRAA
jgi:hypothetical protein